MGLQMTSFCHLSYKRHEQEGWWQYCRALGGNSKSRVWNPCGIALLVNSWVSGGQTAKQNGLRRSFLYGCSKMISDSWKTSTAQLIFKIGMKLKMIIELDIKPGGKKKSGNYLCRNSKDIYVHCCSLCSDIFKDRF